MAHGRRALTMALFLSTAIAPAAPGEAGAEPENGTAEDRNRSRREQPALAVGGRVRVTSSVLERRAEGFVESMDEAALTVVSQKFGSQRIPWETVSRLDLQVGTRRRVAEAMLVTGAVGAVIGLLVPLDDRCDSIATAPPPDPAAGQYSGDPICSRGEHAGEGFVGGALLGMLSAFIAEPQTPRWKRLHAPYQRPHAGPAVSFRLGPARGGVRAQVALTF